MDYPLFLLPHIGGNWLIGATAILHVIIAHFTIGGGLLIVVTEQRAARRDDLFRMGFFNPTYRPSLILRTGIALMLAGVYGWLVTARMPEEPRRPALVRYLSGWTLAGIVLALVGFVWWQANIPAEARDLIFPAGSLLWRTFVAGVAALALLTLLVAIIGYLAPRGFGLTAGIAALILAAIFFGSYERIREGARKPYVIHGYMYSNGIRVDEVDRLNREGLLTKARWAGVGLAATPTVKGEQVFQAQRQMCHSLDGYLAIRPLVAGQDAEGLTAFLDALRGGRPGMPPIIGTEEEIKTLAAYLAWLGGGPR